MEQFLLSPFVSVCSVFAAGTGGGKLGWKEATAGNASAAGDLTDKPAEEGSDAVLHQLSEQVPAKYPSRPEMSPETPALYAQGQVKQSTKT